MKTKTRKITNFKVKNGSEGPKHDPYGYTEYSFTKQGKNYLVHSGLALFVVIDELGEFFQDYDSFSAFVKKHTGVTLKHLGKLEVAETPSYDDPMGCPSDYI